MKKEFVEIERSLGYSEEILSSHGYAFTCATRSAIGSYVIAPIAAAVAGRVFYEIGAHHKKKKAAKAEKAMKKEA